ncbi:hypothetical protein [Glaciimonas soli]|uniref:Single-stranded DNA-binding protein n=1 Tax=Glaciimonas soli TaxID=2590999 RepID=A0A843YJV6_9BURK|nr:hypothetical protein [Glaciimonas soli]MQQ99259.1 hypothetical protein [Glaciimonas soli]
MTTSIDTKNLIEILAINVQSGKSKKTGNDYEIHKAQCVIRGANDSTQVGELNLPKELALTVPGKYLAEFELSINFDRLVIPRVIALHPFPNRSVAPSPTPKAA